MQKGDCLCPPLDPAISSLKPPRLLVYPRGCREHAVFYLPRGKRKQKRRSKAPSAPFRPEAISTLVPAHEKTRRTEKTTRKNNPHRQLRLGHSRLWLDSQSYSSGAPARQREWSASEMVVGMVSTKADFFFLLLARSLPFFLLSKEKVSRGRETLERERGEGNRSYADLEESGERGGEPRLIERERQRATAALLVLREGERGG